jgi:formate dehydrogenase beta subunit
LSVQAKRYPLPLAPSAVAALVPCSHGTGCPLGVDAPAIANAVRLGDHPRAYLIARGPNPFASSCGHGCHAPCESACRRRYFGAPVAIGALEAFASGFSVPALLAAPEPCTSAHDARSVAGLAGRDPLEALHARRSGKRIAIVGAGAAGLACAHDLVLLGHSCAVFDDAPEPGGILTRAIPAFRFPVAAARGECAAILEMGVEYHAGYRIQGTSDLRALLAGEYDAIFLALGASTPRDPMFPDQPEHLDVVDAMRVLADDVPIDARTVVAGDGALAVDAARVALRRAARDGIAGATVQLVLDAPIERSAIPPDLLGAALAEGVQVHSGWIATRYLTDERSALTGVEIARPAERASKILPCDRLIMAGARAPRAATFAPELAIDEHGRIAADPETLETSMLRVWAGGACAFGHRSIAHAVADGKRAAWHIHATLMRQPLRIAVASAWVEVDDWDETRAAHALEAQRADLTHAPPPADPFSSASVRAGDDMVREASRCFDCTVAPVVDESCTACGKCVSVCPEDAFSIVAGPPKQLRLDQDVCTRCGLCVQKCPEGAIAMLRAVWEERLTTEPEPSPLDVDITLHDATPAGGTPVIS